MEIKHVLVTGSDGYIGSVLMEELNRQGYQAVGLDTLYFDTIVLGRYTRKYPLIKSDIRSLDDLDMRRFDAIIHLAALSNDALGQLNPDLTEQINFRATVSLARKAKETGVKRFIFSSSCSVYGRSGNEIENEQSPVHPLTAYAQSKIAAEHALRKLADTSFCVGILRNATVYGYSPKFRSDLVVNNLVSCAIATNEVRIHTNGMAWRPLIDVRDLCDIIIEFLRVDQTCINGKVINVGFEDNNLRVITIAQSIQQELRRCRLVFTGIESIDCRTYRVDFRLFHTLFPHVIQKWPLSKSITDMITHLRQDAFTNNDFSRGTLSRVTQLQRLIAGHRVDANLFWKNPGNES